MKKEYKVYLVGFLILCLIFHFTLKNRIESNIPSFISDKLSQLKESNVLMDSIGGFDHFEFSYNESDLKFKDTVRYSITVKGDYGVLIYKGTQLKANSTDWKLIDETLTIK